MRYRRSMVLLLVPILTALVPKLSAKDPVFVMPRAADAKSYPAHDTSTKEKITVAADPYDLPNKTQSVFRIKYQDEDLLPIFLVVTNDAGQPIALTDMQVELVTRKRIRRPPATEDDVARRIARQPVRGDHPGGSPLPIPRSKTRRSIKKEEETEIQDSRFLAKAVEPHSTQAGFVFFDVEGIEDPLAGAHLYISGIRNGQGQEVIFFDIPLELYLEHAPVK